MLAAFTVIVMFSYPSYSYLKYGLLAARAEILKASGDSDNPCILAGYQGMFKFSVSCVLMLC